MIISLQERTPHIDKDAFVAPNATIIGDVVIGSESSVWFGAVVRADTNRITIGQRSNIQDVSVLHVDFQHPLVIGDGVTVGHRVTLHGCRIGHHVLIGMGALVMNGADIGDESLIAAGSVVTESMRIPPRSLVVGLPAKIKRMLEAREIAELHKNADSYVKGAQGYRALPEFSKKYR